MTPHRMGPAPASPPRPRPPPPPLSPPPLPRLVRCLVHCCAPSRRRCGHHCHYGRRQLAGRPHGGAVSAKWPVAQPASRSRSRTVVLPASGAGRGPRTRSAQVGRWADRALWLVPAESYARCAGLSASSSAGSNAGRYSSTRTSARAPARAPTRTYAGLCAGSYSGSCSANNCSASSRRGRSHRTLVPRTTNTRT